MAASRFQVDFGQTCTKLATCLPPQVCEVRRTRGSEAPGHLARKVWCRKCQASFPEKGMPPEELQDFTWRECFSHPTQWWEKGRSKPTPRYTDFKQKEPMVGLWLNNHHKPAWVDSQVARWEAGINGPRESASTSDHGSRGCAAHDSRLEVGICRKLCDGGRIHDAVDALDMLVQRGCHVPNNLFYCVLKRCVADKDLVLGRRVHALTVESGYEGDDFLATHLIGLYASHGRLEEAMRVFGTVCTPSAHTWANIILTHARHGKATNAIRLYRQMLESAVKPNNHIYSSVLTACKSVGDLDTGKDVHARILTSPEKPDIYVHNCLVDMYAKCGSLEDARSVFDNLPERNVVIWTAMIAGYAQQDMGREALGLYRRMQLEGPTRPDSVTFVCLLKACASLGVVALDEGKELHAQIEELGLQDDVILGGSLVNMYAKCGSLKDARGVFNRLPERNVVAWTAMIAGYAQQGMGQAALTLYSSMEQEGLSPPNSVTFSCLLQACATVGIGALDAGKHLHAQIEQQGLQVDVVLGGSLVNMYAKCGSVEHARRVFDRLPDCNVVTWNAMLAGYAQHGMGQEALSLYRSMQEGLSPPNSVTFVTLLHACAGMGVAALDEGKQLHAQINERGLQCDVALGSSLVNMYAKCGSLQDARRVFHALPQRDVVTWTAMIAGYVQQGIGEEALRLYSGMQEEGLCPPNSVTFVCLLQACAMVAALPLGKQLHAQIKECGFHSDVVVGAALVNMYAKCGSMSDSQQVFDSLRERSAEAWGALLGGYTRQGACDAVFGLLDRMRLECIQPTGVILLSVLTACSHVGLVEKGRKYFAAMRTEYGISPTVEHYTCMMDLLGRAGQLDEALQMAKTMPFPPNGVVWHTLLAACGTWKNVEIGQQAFEFAVRLDAKDSAAYVLMYNIYAKAQMWEEAKEMQARRVRSGAWKKPGHSWWTDQEGVVHTFVVGDKNP